MEKHPPSHAPRALPDGQSRSLLALHIAEYEALMTRNTYLLALQFALWPAVGLILTLGATLWASDKIEIEGRLLIWIAVGGLYLVANNWADTLWELYSNVAYIEHELRSKVSADLGVDGFWGYERFLASHRSLTAAPWELATPAFGTIVIVLTAINARPSSGWQYTVAVFTIACAIRMWCRCLDALRLRLHFTDKILELPRTGFGSRREASRSWLIVGITITMGILPFSILAYSTRTLWFGSSVDSPLAAVPSVWLGDTVLIPILNIRIVSFLSAFFAEYGTRARHVFARGSLVALMASSLIAGYTHYMWTKDQYLGFIDTQLGALSIAGWWHLAFTALEMAFVFTFLFLWHRTATSLGKSYAYSRGELVWRVFFWYALLSVADFLVLHLWSLPRRPTHDYTWHTAWEGMLIVPFWFLIRTSARWVTLQSFSKKQMGHARPFTDPFHGGKKGKDR